MENDLIVIGQILFAALFVPFISVMSMFTLIIIYVKTGQK